MQEVTLISQTSGILHFLENIGLPLVDSSLWTYGIIIAIILFFFNPYIGTALIAIGLFVMYGWQIIVGVLAIIAVVGVLFMAANS